MLTTLAHADEAHSSTIESIAHSLGWYIQIPLFVVSVALFASIMWLTTKRIDRTLLATATLLLFTGFALATVSPLIGILSITIGLLSTLFMTLTGIGTPD